MSVNFRWFSTSQKLLTEALIVHLISHVCITTSILLLIQSLADRTQSLMLSSAVCFLLSTLHSRLVSEQAQLKEELEAVRQDNIQLVREHNHVKQACEELRRLHEDDQREVADMRMLHQQVPETLRWKIKSHSFTDAHTLIFVPDFPFDQTV